MKEVSVIIVNYNTLAITRDCIASVVEHSRDVDYEIIVVDNASTDGSRDYFATDRRIRYIYNDENVGFGRANNIGMRAATGKYLLLLNSDTLLLNNALRLLYDAAEAYGAGLGVMGAILLSPAQQPTHSYGQFITICSSLREPFARLWNRLSHTQSDLYHPTIPQECRPVEYISGADMFVPRRVFERTGGFDEDFFMYAEDAEWQYRIAALGLARVVIGSPRIIHLEGASDASQHRRWSYTRFYNALRSRMLYIRKHNSRVAYAAFRCLYALVRMPSIVLAPYAWHQKRSLLRLITIEKL